VWRLWFPDRPGGDPSVVGGAAQTGALPKYLEAGHRAGTQLTRCGPGRVHLGWGGALPKWFSYPANIACISSEWVGFACFG